MLNVVRPYDWGSHTALAALQGRPRATEPEAELWMGAHPLASSSVVLPGGPRALADLLDSEPTAVLGRADAERFGRRLPFLLKVLAVERALSVQVHPGSARAAGGFAAEEAAGVPMSSSRRTFVDPYGKPEFLYALSPFVALAGLRDATGTAALLRLLGLPALTEILRALHGPSALDPTAGGRDLVARAMASILHWPAPDRAGFSAATARRAGELLAGAGADLDDEQRAVLAVVVRLAEEHPGDVLVVAPLLLQLHALPPGGTIFLPTGVPHAYLGGLAVEIMAASDNVVRAGLTTKHVDPEELLAALDPRRDASVGWLPQGGTGPDVSVWTVPVPDFSLARLVVGLGGKPVPEGLTGARIVLCTEGRVVVRAATGELSLRAGTSAFVPASAGPVVLQGPGEAFVAAPGRTIG
jgi:mannose-6-phosphate isomerase